MFCPSCGKQIPDQSSFCLACGKAIHTVAEPSSAGAWQPHTQSGFQPGAPAYAESIAAKPIFSRLGVLTIGALLVVMFFAVRKFGQGPADGPSPSLLRPFSQQMLSGSVAVAPLHVQYWKFSVTPTMTNAHVTGNFHTTGGFGNDIEAIVAEWGECENWINGHQAQVVYQSGKVTNGELDVPIHQTGTYCLAFSNKMALLSGKTVSGSVELQYLLP